ncbi:MAG: nucleotidyl transferase AbiEii/AbiGii toxin family protein [Faecalibacterium sp.]
MADIAASILAKLKNKAAQSGRSYQLCMQLFCQEEFLRRVGKSRYRNNLVLKGGLFLYSITNFESRVTADVDFLLRHQPNTPERLQAILDDIIAIDTGNDFISFEVKSISPIAVAKKYTGISATMVARIKNTRTPFSIDFGVGDVIVPQQETRTLPTQLAEFEAPVLQTYSIETVVAEKIDAILSLMEFSSRMKDYYDLYYLSQQFDFDGDILTQALRKTFENREHHFTQDQFEQIMHCNTDEGMQKKWVAFQKKLDAETEDFATVLHTIHHFLAEPFSAVMQEATFAKQWVADTSNWQTDAILT